MIVETQINSLAILFSLCESLHPSIIRQWCVGFPPMVLFPIGVLRFRFRHETFPFLLRNIYGLAFSKSKKRFRPQIWDPGETDSDCTELQYRLWPDLIHSIYDEEEFSRWPLVFPEWVLAYLCSQKLTGDEEIQRLRCIVKNYERGKFGPDSLVGRLHEANSGRQVDRLIPQAEFWMGTHESGPSHVEFGLGYNKDEKCLVTLKSWVLDNPNVLGSKVVDKRGCDLPFLFKVLSVTKALPIQAQVYVDVILDLKRRVKFKPNCYYKSHNRLIIRCCRLSLVFYPDRFLLEILSSNSWWYWKHLLWQQTWVIRQRRIPNDQREALQESPNILISRKRQDTVLSPTTLSSHFKSKVMPKAFWSLSSKLLANNKYVKEGHNRLFHLLAWQTSERIAWLLSTLSSKLFQFPIFAYNGCIVLVLYFVNSF